MAKALPVPDLQPDQSFSLAAAGVIEVRSGELIESISRLTPGVAPSPDDVHGVRVCARRLRTAIEFFRPCLPGRRAKKALREVTKVADAFSVQRDLDVWIELLIKYQADVGDGQGAGVDLLITDLLGEREKERSDATGFDTTQVEAIRELLASLVEHARDRAPDSADHSGSSEETTEEGPK